jgi:molecular chaperone GrpE (heat shock protein)
MKTTLSRLALLLACITPVGSVALHAADQPYAENEDTELGDAMSSMNSALKKLRRQVADPAQNEASLVLVAKLRKGCVDSVALLPTTIERMPAAAQAAAKLAYQDKMKELIVTVDELAAALKAGKNEVATGLINVLIEHEKAGHKQFRPKGK